MRSVYSERCPHCKQELYHSRVEENKEKKFGCSLQRCPFCYSPYLDTHTFEWVNLNQEEKKCVLVFGPDRTIVTESTMREALNKRRFTRGIPILGSSVNVLEAQLRLYDIFVFKKEMLNRPHILESIKRTSDPDYMRTLLNSGRNYYGTDYNET